MNLIGREPQTKSSALLAGLALGVLALVPYLQAARFEFITFDDQLYVFQNAQVLQGLTWESVGWAFRTFVTGNWHPLTWLSHMLDVQIWGTHAGGHHLTSVLWHALNTMLVFVILRQMTGSLWRSALTAALFAIHPLHVESVAWVAERKDVLSTFFGLIALWAYTGYARSGSRTRYFCTLGCFALSLMAKQMWVTFPFLLLLLDFWPLRRWRFGEAETPASDFPQPRSLTFLLLEKIPLFILAAVACGIALVAQRAGHNVFGGAEFSLSARIGNALVAYAAYLVKLVAPFRLAFFYPHPISWPLGTILSSGALLGAVTVGAWVSRRTRPWLLVGWLWFLGTLIPVIGLVQIGGQTIADRYTYLPSIGFFIILVWSIPDRLPRGLARLATATVAVMIVFLTLKTARQASYWRNSLALYTHATQVSPGNFMAHLNLASLRVKQNDLTGALELFRRAESERPAYAKINVHEHIAEILMAQGRYVTAREELEAAIRLNPKSSAAHNSLGSIFVLWDEKERAADLFRQAIELDEANTAARVNYGITLTALARWDEAIAQLEPVVQREPERLVARASLARAWAGRGEVARAIAELDAVLKLDPNSAAASEALREIQGKSQP